MSDDIGREVSAIRADDAIGMKPVFINSKVGDLIRAWSNEKASPELLPYRGDLVDELRADVDTQLGELRRGAVDGVYLPGLYRLDIERVKFALAAYLRARVGKVRYRCLNVHLSCASKSWRLKI